MPYCCPFVMQTRSNHCKCATASSSKICRDKLVGHYPIAATDLMLNQLNLRVLLINSIGKQRLAKRRIEYKCRFTSPMIYL